MARTKAPAVPPDVVAPQDLPPASAAFRPLTSGSTSGSWLVSFARRGPDPRPEYCLKVRKAVRTLAASRKIAEQLSPYLEYRTTGALREYFANFTEFANSIPRAVRYLPDCEGILTEYRHGRHLKDALFAGGNVLSAAWRPGALYDISAACGRWLRLLHEMSPPDWLPAHPVDPSALSHRTREIASLLKPDVARHLPLDRLLGWIDELAPGDGHRMAVSHGDFQPGNVLVSGSEICVIDLVAAGVRPVEDDLSFFLTFVFTHKERIAFGNAAGTRSFVRRFCEAFLRGYGFQRSQGMVNLRPYVAWLIVQRLVDMNARIERWPRVPRLLLRARLVGWVRSELPLFLQEFE